MLESLIGRCECRRAVRLTYSAHTQAQIWGFELSHSNIYPVDELLECLKEQVLQIQSCRISMTQGNNGIQEESQ